MSEQNYGSFIASILYTLKKNGFPDKRVALGVDKMYGLAYERSLNFNKVLVFLEEKGIGHEKKDGKIVFFEKELTPQVEAEQAKEPSGSPSSRSDQSQTTGDPFSAFASQFSSEDLQRFKNMDLKSIMANASDLLKHLSPEQLQQMQNMMANLTDEQRREMMEKAKAMGLF